jgi:hypothetical protein
MLKLKITPKYGSLFILLVSLLVSSPAFGESAGIAWESRYNGPGNGDDYAYAIARDDSGNIYVTGGSYGSGGDEDYATIKYYPSGEVAWVRRYNGIGFNHDRAYAMALDNLNNIYVTGGSYGQGTSFDYVTIKYYPNGDTGWVRRYDGPGNAEDFAQAIAVDDSNNVYVTGYSLGNGTYEDYATVKYYPNGDTAWVRRYDGPADYTDRAMAISIDRFGHICVTGVSYSNETYFDYATIMYYPNGDTAWVRRYNGAENSDDCANAIATDEAGNVFVTGQSDMDFVTIKYDSSGNELWIGRYVGTNLVAQANAIVLDESGNVYVTGGAYDMYTAYDYATVKYDQAGEQIWAKRYDSCYS